MTKNIAKTLKLKIVSVTDRQNNREEKEQLLKDSGVLVSASIEEVVFHLKNASFIITDSFHGFCFALIFNKPFSILVNKIRGSSRFDTLQEIAGVEDRMIYDLDKAINLDKKFLINMDYEKINNNLNLAIKNSKEWLNIALTSEKKEVRISSEILVGKELYEAKKKIAKLEKILSNIQDKLK